MYKRRCVVEGHSDFSSFIYLSRFVPPLNRKTHFSRSEILKNLISAILIDTSDFFNVSDLENRNFLFKGDKIQG